MVMCNYFNLIDLHPKDVYEWFMSVVCIDSADIYMIGNIFGMGLNSCKILSKRTYISSSNYLV